LYRHRVKATYFADLATWRAWLERHHESESEVWVGFWKRGTGEASITWPESVDGALCFGWIDGVRQSIDERRYRIRFTPRKTSSNWSRINVEKMEELIAAGLVHERGIAAFRARKAAKTAIYSYERAHASLTPDEEKALRADKKAWADWEKRPPWYRRTATHWVASAKKPETRARRFATLRASSAAGKPVPPLAWPGPRAARSASTRGSRRARRA
jgi:uncharacterized protein YdeI (YjbR/CyaY-like superfamily)